MICQNQAKNKCISYACLKSKLIFRKIEFKFCDGFKTKITWQPYLKITGNNTRFDTPRQNQISIYIITFFFHDTTIV